MQPAINKMQMSNAGVSMIEVLYFFFFFFFLLYHRTYSIILTLYLNYLHFIYCYLIGQVAFFYFINFISFIYIINNVHIMHGIATKKGLHDIHTTLYLY